MLGLIMLGSVVVTIAGACVGEVIYDKVEDVVDKFSNTKDGEEE